VSLINLNSFLSLGYFLNYKSPYNNIAHVQGDRKDEYTKLSLTEIIRLGVDIYIKSIEEQFDRNSKHLVPISGGYDSRGILAALLEFTEAKNISTYTFGTPHTYDYDIGNLIAKRIGTHHTNFDLTNYPYSQDELIDISKRIEYQTTLFHHPPIWEMEKIFESYTIWSGVSIESWFGSHFTGNDFESLLSAKTKFIKENIYVKSTNLMNIDLFDLKSLIDYSAIPGVPKSIILDVLNRQFKYNIPHVLPNGFNYKVIFHNNLLTEFALSLPHEYLVNRYMYHKILQSAFPAVFKLPIKSNYGLPACSNKFKTTARRIKNTIYKTIGCLDPTINYVDFDFEIRNNNRLKTIIYNNVFDLKRREIIDWINFDKIWQAHINKTANHSDALITLTSLEIHLKAGKVL